MYQLATQAGQAQYAARQEERRDEKQMLAMKLGHERRQQAFMLKAQEQARAEEAQYQMLLLQAKRQIDIQTETANYARQKQMLTQSLNMINESNEINDADKERLRIQAMTKYAGLGQGVTAASFSQNKGLSAMIQKDAYRAKMIEELSKQTESGQLDPNTAENLMPGTKFYGPGERGTELRVGAQKRLATAQKNLSEQFIETGGKLTDRYENRIRKSDPQYQLYLSLKQQVIDAKEELDKVTVAAEEPELRAKFGDILQTSPAARRLVERFGGNVEDAFDAWRKAAKKNYDMRGPKFSEEHPILDKVWKGAHAFPPVAAASGFKYATTGEFGL
jgi:hypothetical protein